MGEDKGRHFLVIVDQFSGWPHFTMFQNKITTARRLIDEFRSFFVSIGGAPIKIWSDNGLFPAAEFQDFLRDWKVGWESSSPHYPQSNGRAEAGIKAIKALVAGSRTGGTFDQNKMAKALSSTETHPAWASSRPHN
jgi:transposase InsO family protein